MWRVWLVLGAVLLGLILAIRYLPGWACLGLVVAALLLPVVVQLVVWWKVRSFVKELGTETPPGMPALFATFFKMKGSVLRKARVVVHSVEPAGPPLTLSGAGHGDEVPVHGPAPERAVVSPGESRAGPEAETSPADPPREYYLLEVTIKPRRWGIGFKRWQPGELALTTPDSGWLDQDDACVIAQLWVRHGNDFAAESDLRYAGAQRLRLLVGARPGVKRLVFRYYTERFGEVILPATHRLPAPG